MGFLENNRHLIAFMGIILMAVMLMYPSVLAISYSDNTYGKIVKPTQTPLIVGANYSINVNDTEHLQGRDTSQLYTYFQSLFNSVYYSISNPLSFINQTQADSLYCKLTGCTMNGNINLNNYNITANNLCYSNGSNCQSSSSTPIIAGFYFTNFSTYKSASQTFPCMENPVEYYNLTLLETPNSNNEVNINLTNGIITIPETGKYRVYYSVHGYFGTTTMLKEFGVYVNNVSKASYSPLFIRTPTTNLFLPYSQTEILSLNQGDNISIYLTNNGASATATTFYFHGLKLEVEKI